MDASVIGTAGVIDVREPDSVLRTINDARRRFEKGGPAPIAAQDLAVNLFNALADSGPLELGVSPRWWLHTNAKVEKNINRMRPATEANAWAVEDALVDLRRIFRRAVWSLRWRARFHNPERAPRALFALCSGLLIGGTWLVEALAHGEVAARWLLPGLLFLFIFFLVTAHARQRAKDAAIAREVAADLAPGERWLCNARMPKRKVVIATDRRLLIATPAHGRHRVNLVWSATYDDILYSSQASDRRIVVQTRKDSTTIELRSLIWLEEGDYQSDHQAALLAILRRHKSRR